MPKQGGPRLASFRVWDLGISLARSSQAPSLRFTAPPDPKELQRVCVRKVESLIEEIDGDEDIELPVTKVL